MTRTSLRLSANIEAIIGIIQDVFPMLSELAMYTIKSQD